MVALWKEGVSYERGAPVPWDVNMSCTVYFDEEVAGGSREHVAVHPVENTPVPGEQRGA